MDKSGEERQAEQSAQWKHDVDLSEENRNDKKEEMKNREEGTGKRKRKEGVGRGKERSYSKRKWTEIKKRTLVDGKGDGEEGRESGSRKD